MTRFVVGPTWSQYTDAQHKALIDAFTRVTVASYAHNFDSFNGEKFAVDPAVTDRNGDKLVKSTLTPAGAAAIPFNYRLHNAGGWKIVDIYLNGTISQLAQKRSDFGATLQASGPQGLAKKINALADQTLG